MNQKREISHSKEKVSQEQWDKLYKFYHEDNEIMDMLFEIDNAFENNNFVFNKSATSLKDIISDEDITETMVHLIKIQNDFNKLKREESIKEQIEYLEDIFFDIKENDMILKVMIYLLVNKPKDIID